MATTFDFIEWPDLKATQLGGRVIIESPYAGDIERNIAFARAAMRDSLMRGEYPIASHLLYTQDGILDDSIPDERQLGIAAGLDWGKFADYTVVYMNYGVSSGMQQGIDAANKLGRPVIYRTLEGWTWPTKKS